MSGIRSVRYRTEKKTYDARTGPCTGRSWLSVDIFLVQYWTKIRDAGMPMPALFSSMPMPSYAFDYKESIRVTREATFPTSNSALLLYILGGGGT